MIYQAATRLGYQSHFFARTNQIEDDHKPFMQRGIPSADLIDLEYGYDNVFWHTTQDTVDKLSPKSTRDRGHRDSRDGADAGQEVKLVPRKCEQLVGTI